LGGQQKDNQNYNDAAWKRGKQFSLVGR